MEAIKTKQQYRTAIDKLGRMLDANQKARDECQKYDTLLELKKKEYNDASSELVGLGTKLHDVSSQIVELTKEKSSLSKEITEINKQIKIYSSKEQNKRRAVDRVGKVLAQKKNEADLEIDDIEKGIISQRHFQDEVVKETGELQIKLRTIESIIENENKKSQPIIENRNKILKEIEELKQMKKELEHDIEILSIKYITNGSV